MDFLFHFDHSVPAIRTFEEIAKAFEKGCKSKNFKIAEFKVGESVEKFLKDLVVESVHRLLPSGNENEPELSPMNNILWIWILLFGLLTSS